MKKDLLSINDFSRKEILTLFDKSKNLKAKRKKGIEHLPLKGKSLGMIFNKTLLAREYLLKLECTNSVAKQFF